uniref:virulence associated lipoprotein n=1 Tax=Borrelia hermsii TaxID=140 RepID=UPI0011EA634C|nr:virulence associated lipoprotein [Borrelia hermsii]
MLITLFNLENKENILKHKVFIICILTGLILLGCNQNSKEKEDPTTPVDTAQQEKAAKQAIIDDLTAKAQQVETELSTHKDTAWDETAQAYDISGADQLFDAIEYDNAQSQKTKYNGNDNESKKARREMYLAFAYKKDDIKAFGALANKMTAPGAPPEMKGTLEMIVDNMRQYARDFYLTAFDTLTSKKDRLMELTLSDLKILKTKFHILLASKTNLKSAADVIIGDYNNDIEIGAANPKHKLKTNATAEEIKKYLEDKKNIFTTDLNTVKNDVPKIITILNKIQ